MQQLLATMPRASVRPLVVWEPVLLSDVAPPTTHALARVSDPRAAQFWDPERSLSRLMGGADDVVWDYVALYPSGARWDAALPPAVFEGSPVVEAIEEVRRHMARQR